LVMWRLWGAMGDNDDNDIVVIICGVSCFTFCARSWLKVKWWGFVGLPMSSWWGVVTLVVVVGVAVTCGGGRHLCPRRGGGLPPSLLSRWLPGIALVVVVGGGSGGGWVVVVVDVADDAAVLSLICGMHE
jgi:hypothetical protein